MTTPDNDENDERDAPGGALPAGEEAAPGPGEGPQDGSSAGDELSDLRKKAEERDVYRSELLRSRADYDNLQKRVRKERPVWEDLAVRRFVRDLLPVVDNFERALASAGDEGVDRESLETGVQLTRQMMLQALADHGVHEIPALGEMFNPELHEAVAEVEVDDRPTGEILEVLQKGYGHGDALIRPSRVKVAKNVKKESTHRADL